MDKQLIMYEALKRISKYQSPEQLHRSAGRDFGLEYGEALEMAYENAVQEAKTAVKGMRKPK